ncbi:MAG: hypothetical protein LBS97_06825 [Treponema sp.]|jgi:hypothetical protein|nr:hypothetical protein [Treponema sp.]
MENSLHIVPLASPPFDGPEIQEGSPVFVRVLEQAGNNKFLVSFAGRRFFAAADVSLVPGAAFPARITVRNGRVELVPLLQIVSLNSPSRIFESLGLPPDPVSALIVRFFQQYGFKFEGPLADKARRIARQFPGKEEDAAEGTLFLAEKGIEPDAERLSALLGLLNGGGQRQNSDGMAFAQDNAPPEQAGEQSFMRKLYPGSVQPETANPGLLTLVNHIVSSEKHWITLPFTLPPSSAPGKAENGANGIVRILLDTGARRTEKIEVRACFPEKTWYITVRYAVGRPVEVLFFVEPESDSPEWLEKTLAKVLGEDTPTVRYAPEAKAGHFFTGEAALEAVEAEG